jgi:DNA-binding beta-propeller fold protein YncE
MLRRIGTHRYTIPRAVVLAAVVTIAALAVTPARALASATLYWGWAYIPNNTAVADSGIAFTSLDGSSGGNLPLAGATAEHPLGDAIDAATGTIYWVNFGSSISYCSGALAGGNTISYAKLNGSGSGTLNTSGATVSGPDGLAIDPTAGRVYWANDHANSISFAALDGTGGHNLNTAGATVSCPAGVAVDPALGKIFWTNYSGNTISYANLDGSGGGDLPIASQTISDPWGIAVDPANGKLYWSNCDSNSIGYANLDGSGAAVLNTSGATVACPWGVAIDPSAGMLYWANDIGKAVSYARLDGTGAGNLSTSAPVDHPKYPILLEPPTATSAPVITGAATIGSRLSCSSGVWAADLPESFLYRAPETLAYRWFRDGTPVGPSSSAISADLPGSYACQVTASNFAGPGEQTSAGLTVAVPPVNVVSIRSHSVSRRGSVAIRVLIPAPGTLNARATFTNKLRRAGRKSSLYGTGSLAVGGAGAATLMIQPTGGASAQLRSGRSVTVIVALTFTRVDGAVARARLRVVVTLR